MQDMLASRLPNPGTNALDPSAARPAGRVDGQAENAARLREAAKEFEALFLGYLLNVMRETVEESGLTGGGLGQDVYTQLFDQELARALAGRGALGISDMLMRKLSEEPSAPLPKALDRNARVQTPGPGAAPHPAEFDEIPDFRMPIQAHFSSAFGLRRDPLTHEKRFHRGADLAAPEGMEVRAAGAGRVVFSGYEKGYGNTVVVKHSGGFETRYAHLGTLLVSAGDVMGSDQVLGTVGHSGRSTGPHLHFEVSRYGGRVDPKTLMTD